MKQDSVFGGRLVWYDAFLGDGTANSEIALCPNYVYTETVANFTARRSSNGLNMVLDLLGTGGGYTDKIHLRCQHRGIGANFEMLCRYTGVDNTVEQFQTFFLRGDGTVGAGIFAAVDRNCLYVQQYPDIDVIQVYRVVNSAQTQIGSDVSFAASTNDVWVRFAVVGTNIYAKFWNDGTSEPAAWMFTGTDTVITTGSHFGIGFSGGNSGVITWTHIVKDLYVWDLDLSEREASLA